LAIPARALDDRDDIVELDFADTSALSDVAKLLKNDRAREREDIERSWDVPGEVTVNVVNVNAGSPHAALGKPSPVPSRTAGPAIGSGTSPSPVQRYNETRL